MNIQHMKYAVEVAKAGSINRAAERLLVAQPNLSRSIKELEADLGITIFDRSAKGMELTPDGEEFLDYAKAILAQIVRVEAIYKNGAQTKQLFSLCAPRASYISAAFAQFSKGIPDSAAELFYKETNSSRTISSVLEDEYKLGIVRYAVNYDRYFQANFEEKGLVSEQVSEFSYVLVTRADSELARLQKLRAADLESKIEIAHADPYVPSLPLARVKKEELSGTRRRIFVFERASQFDLLAENPETFMWMSPLPKSTLERYGLVQHTGAPNGKRYKDVLIYKKEYRLSALDKQFITELCFSKRKYLG